MQLFVAQKVDIKKFCSPTHLYYESVDDSFAVTFTGRLKGITDAGRFLFQKVKPYCRLVRRLIKMLQAGEEPNKSALSAKYTLAGRMYNTALMQAQAMIASAIECQKRTLEDLEIDINRQVVAAFQGSSDELHGRVKKLKRLYKQRKELLKKQSRPPIHVGRKFFQDQFKPTWKLAYTKARHDRISCIGSADELGGNSTFQIKPLNLAGQLRFELRHARQTIGQFRLSPKETEELAAILAINHQPFQFSKVKATQGKNKGRQTLRKITKGRVPLQVTLLREDNGHWYVKVTFFKDQVAPSYLPVGAIGVDLNCDSIADTWMRMVDGSTQMVQHNKRMFDPDWSKSKKENWIYQQINEIVATAKKNHLMICLEYLDFEYCKRWLRSKLGAMLRVMPYRKIRKAFERRCMEHGVVLRYVKSKHTSLLGAVLTDYPNLGRDQAAAAVIGLRGLEAGNQWLEKKCEELLKEERSRLRINRKSNFGYTVTAVGGLERKQTLELNDRRRKDKPEVTQALSGDRSTTAHEFQNCAGRAISELSKAMGAYSRQGKRVPGCWKRSEDEWIPLVIRFDTPRAAVGLETKRSLEELECSSLSN